MFDFLGTSKTLDSAKGVVDAVGGLFTSDDERLTRAEVIAKLEAKQAAGQVEINKVEATHRSLFVAGWRPMVGWICAFSLLWHFILYDLLSWVALAYNLEMPPILSGTEHLMTLVLSLLGFGGFRTYEKIKGVTK